MEQYGGVPMGSQGRIENQVLLNLDLVLLPADKLPLKFVNYESKSFG